MNCIEILDIPSFNFAHSFDSDRYQNSFVQNKNTIEITYICEGEISVETKTNKFIAGAGDVICNIHSSPVKIYSDKYHLHRTVSLNVRWDFPSHEHGGMYTDILIKSSPESQKIIKIINEFVFSSYKYENSPTFCAHLFFDMLSEIDEYCRNNADFPTSEYSLISEKTKKYVQNNITRKITQKEIASYLGITPGYLCVAFKKTEGIPVMRYINLLKLKNIRILMEKENIRLYEAASIYGYSDANYVSYLYKKLYGHSISRTMIRNNPDRF